MEGFIYLLTNEAMPGYVKIGKTTTSIEQRIRELSRSTSVPLPFEAVYAAKVTDIKTVEEALHYAFGDFRKNKKREFFLVSPERVVAVLKLLAIQEVKLARDVGVETKEDAVAIQEARKKRSAFNFKMVKIPAGATLNFIRDEKITCRVAPDQKHVVFKGKEMSSSEAAAKALGSKWWVQGPAYWLYKGKTLDEIRGKLDNLYDF